MTLFGGPSSFCLFFTCFYVVMFVVVLVHLPVVDSLVADFLTTDPQWSMELLVGAAG